MTEHFYREKDQYDMMCAAREGPTGTQMKWWWTCYFASRDHAKHRRCYRPTCPGLISSSRDQVELPACPPVDRPPLLDVSEVPECLGSW